MKQQTLKLEINVFDRVKVIDVVGTDMVELTEHVARCVLKWIEDGSSAPLKITVRKLSTRGPPGKSLKINVHEKVKVTSAFGTK